MAIVQSAYAESTGSDAVATLASPVTSGNAVLLAFFLLDYASSDPGGTGAGLSGASGSPPDVLFDDKGNSYTKLQITAPLDSPLYNPMGGVYFYACANITNAPSVFTLHDSSFRTTIISVVELSGRDSALVIGVSTTPVQFTSTTTPTAGFTTGTNDEDVIQMTVWDGLGTDTSFTAGSGWTKISPSVDKTYGVSARNIATAGSYSVSPTLGASESGDILYLSLRAPANVIAQPGAGALTLTGRAPAAVSGFVRAPGAGALAVAGHTPALVRGFVRSPSAAALTLAGPAPTIVVSSGALVQPGVGALLLTGLAPSLLIGSVVSPSAAALALAGLAPSLAVSDNATAQPGVGALLLAGLAPSLLIGSVVSPGIGVLTLAGFAPALAVTDNQTVQPGAGTLTLAGQTPQVTASESGVVQPFPGTLALTGFAPVVTATDNQTTQPSPGTLTITGLAPSIRVAQVVAPGAADLQLTGYGPQILVSDNHIARPGAGTLSLSGLKPGVVIEGSFVVQPGTGVLTFEGLVPTIVSQPNVDLASAKYGARRKKHKNVEFKPLKQSEPLPADITNMPDAPPASEPIAAKLARGVVESGLDAVAPETPKPVTKSPLRPVAPVMLAGPPPPPGAKTTAEPPPAPQVPTVDVAAVRATIQAAIAKLEADSRARFDALHTELQTKLEVMAAEILALQTQREELTVSAVRAADLRARNQKRAQEITSRLLGS